MIRKLAEKDESKEEKDEDIDNDTKKVQTNDNREVIEVVETDNDKLVVDAANDVPPPQDAPTTNTTSWRSARPYLTPYGQPHHHPIPILPVQNTLLLKLQTS